MSIDKIVGEMFRKAFNSRGSVPLEALDNNVKIHVKKEVDARDRAKEFLEGFAYIYQAIDMVADISTPDSGPGRPEKHHPSDCIGSTEPSYDGKCLVIRVSGETLEVEYVGFHKPKEDDL